MHLCPKSTYTRQTQIYTLLENIPFHSRTILCGDFNCYMPEDDIDSRLYSTIWQFGDPFYWNRSDTFLMDEHKRWGCNYNIDRIYLSKDLWDSQRERNSDVILCSDGKLLT